jgi:hypothetical protein
VPFGGREVPEAATIVSLGGVGLDTVAGRGGGGGSGGCAAFVLILIDDDLGRGGGNLASGTGGRITGTEFLSFVL